jgi:tRNA threonylcarbamoyladenosine biosynthesis protein TsaE
MTPTSPCQHARYARNYKTHTHTQTAALGRAIGQKLNGGLVLLLYGDLGSGKTAFAQGLARGLEVPTAFTISSPTYTLVNEYPGRLPFYHVDLYRLPAPVDPDDIGLHEIFESDGVVAVEWSQRLHPSDRPSCRIDLHFTITGDTTRSIRIIAYGLEFADLLNDIDV